jgi:hypothetical protein
MSVLWVPGSYAYKHKDKASNGAWDHELSRVSQLLTPPPSRGGLRRYHMSLSFGSRLIVKVSFDVDTCPEL